MCVDPIWVHYSGLQKEGSGELRYRARSGTIYCNNPPLFSFHYLPSIAAVYEGVLCAAQRRRLIQINVQNTEIRLQLC